MYEAYPNELERQLIFSLIQMLWDRAEANGYAHHMTATRTEHAAARGDAARRPRRPPGCAGDSGGRGAHDRRVRADALVDPGRDSHADPHYAIPGIPTFPFAGSALVLWDIGPKRTENGETVGTEVPPTTNTPPGEQAGEVRTISP